MRPRLRQPDRRLAATVVERGPTRYEECRAEPAHHFATGMEEDPRTALCWCEARVLSLKRCATRRPEGGEAGEPHMTGFSVTVLPDADGTTVMRLVGEADLSTTALRDALATEIAGNPRLLLIDLAALTFIDSGATQMIIGAYQALSLGGGTLALVHPHDTVGRVLELTGISEVIPVYANVNEAIAAAR